jgi:hypothetical protein
VGSRPSLGWFSPRDQDLEQSWLPEQSAFVRLRGTGQRVEEGKPVMTRAAEAGHTRRSGDVNRWIPEKGRWAREHQGFQRPPQGRGKAHTSPVLTRKNASVCLTFGRTQSARPTWSILFGRITQVRYLRLSTGENDHAHAQEVGAWGTASTGE